MCPMRNTISVTGVTVMLFGDAGDASQNPGFMRASGPRAGATL